MECDGQHISSPDPDMTMNFRTSDNNEEILEILRNFQLVSREKNDTKSKITSEIFNENGAAYILLKSNFCERPLKLLIDTGASITLLANDLAPETTNVINYIIKLFGVVKDISIETQGMMHGTFDINGEKFETILHLVDRKYAGPADGYLGYDFLSTYKTIIDMNQMKIQFNLEPKMARKEQIIENQENFLDILAKSYDFEGFEKENEQKIERNLRLSKINKAELAKLKRESKYWQTKDQRKAERWNKEKKRKHELEKSKAELLQLIGAIDKKCTDYCETETGQQREPVRSTLKKLQKTVLHIAEKFMNEHEKICKQNSETKECIEQIQQQNPENSRWQEAMNNFKIYDDLNLITWHDAIDEDEFKENVEILDMLNEEIDEETSNLLENEVNFPSKISPNCNRTEFIYNKLKLDDCSVDEKQFIKQICTNFPYQFYLEGDILGATHVTEHQIILKPDAKVVNLRQYRIPQTHKQILEDIVADFERQGIIEKCQSRFNSPALLIGKKDDTGEKNELRLVIDYRKVNENTEIQNFPIPLIDDILNGLSGCSIFTTLDIKGAFHQLFMEKKSREYTAFTAGNFQYWWNRMPLGLATAPLTWQRAINTIMADLIGKGVYVYLDDVIIYAKTKAEHDQILVQVMNLLKQHNLQLKISKCTFYAKDFEYLGHIISKDGMKANPKKIEVIKNYPRPLTIKKIQSFLGLCSYFRRYVKDFSKIARPLTSLLKKEVPFIWTEAQENAFQKLKTALAEEVILAFPNFNDPAALFYVTCDSSDYAIGACLSQGELPNDRPIFFFSKTLSETQRRYATIHKELLAIVEALKAFHVYLYGRFFVLITDHKPLCYLFNMKDCGSRLFRQKLELMDYNFKILYRPGAQNVVADALSRIEPLSISEMLEHEKKRENFVVTRNQAKNQRPQDDAEDLFVDEIDGTCFLKRHYEVIFYLVPTENDNLKNAISNALGIVNFENEFHNLRNFYYYRTISNQFANIQNQTETEKCIREMLEISNESLAEDIAIHIDFDNIRHYIYFKNLLIEIFKNTGMNITLYLNKILTLTEREDIEQILKLYHESLLGGHVGRDKMYKTIKKFYRWDKMVEDIANHVKKCSICEKTKVITNTKVPMQISSLGESLFDHVFIDFVGPIPASAMGKKYIFTAICDLTKFFVGVPTDDCSASTAAKCLLEHIICRYNFPSRIISDNATSFTSQVIKELMNLFSIKKIFTTPYHPQSNIVERSHKTLNAYLRAFTDKNKEHWDELLKFSTFVYNNTVHSTTGYTPHELAHGFKIQIPNKLTKPKLSYNYDNLADIVRNTIASALEIAKQNLHTQKLKNKRYYDKNAAEADIQANDYVLVKDPLKKHKFQNVYDGPFKVINAYDSYIEILRRGKKVKIHKNMTKKVNADHNINLN